MDKKIMIGTGCGFLCGALVSFVFQEWRIKKMLKTMEDNLADALVDELSFDTLSSILDKDMGENDSTESDCFIDSVEEQEEITNNKKEEENDNLSAETRKKKLLKNYTVTTNYAEMYDNKKEDKKLSTVRYTEEEEEAERMEQEIEESLLEIKNFGGTDKNFYKLGEGMDEELRRTGIIDFCSLFYHAFSDEYLDEEMNLIDECEVNKILGDSSERDYYGLTNFEISDEEDHCLVLNKELQTVYTIDKIYLGEV